jgi:hypothetical protein
MSFVKLHSSLLNSTIWRENNETRILWITMLAMADQYGLVEASVPGLADRARLTIEATREALATLMGPDPDSRTKDDDGRRIAVIDGGWRLTNYDKHRERRSPEERREQNRLAKEAQRRRQPTVATTATTIPTTIPNRSKLRNGYAFFVATTKGVKIGFSPNPWARLAEMKRVDPSTRFLGMEDSTNLVQEHWQSLFESDRLRGDWFKSSPALLALAATLPPGKRGLDDSTTICPATSAQAEAEAEAEQKGRLLRNLPVTGQPGHGEVVDSGMDPEELASNMLDGLSTAVGTAEAARIDVELAQPLALEGTIDTDKRGFPWRQMMGVVKRIVPEVMMPPKGYRGDWVMRRFWKERGKTVRCFELLAEKVKESDFIMARNVHTGNAGKPYSWGWIFDKDKKGRVRADRIMDDEFSNEKMAFVPAARAKEAAPKLTRVILGMPNCPEELNLAELWNGKPRYRVVATHPCGLPEVTDDKF